MRIDAPGIQIDRSLDLERMPDLLRVMLSGPVADADQPGTASADEGGQGWGRGAQPEAETAPRPETVSARRAGFNPAEEADWLDEMESEGLGPEGEPGLDDGDEGTATAADRAEDASPSAVSPAEAWPRPARRAVRPGSPPRPGRLLAETAGGSGVRTYLRAKRPPTNPERIAVVGRYLELAEGVSAFSRSDLREGLADAGIPEPRNFARDLQTALARGYLVALSDGSRLQVAGAIRDLIDRDGPVWLPRGGKREAVFDTDPDADFEDEVEVEMAEQVQEGT